MSPKRKARSGGDAPRSVADDPNPYKPGTGAHIGFNYFRSDPEWVAEQDRLRDEADASGAVDHSVKPEPSAADLAAPWNAPGAQPVVDESEPA